jgi:hypothetical protein
MVIRIPRRHISYSFPVNLVGNFATVAAVRIIGWTIYAPVQWLNGCPRQVGGDGRAKLLRAIGYPYRQRQ